MTSGELSESFAQARAYAQAIDRCGQLAGWATLYDWWRRLRGEATDLVAFEAIVRRTHGYQRVHRDLRLVPLAQIVGSVGRRHDFTADFLPRRCVSRQRWARIDRAFALGVALPVVELYQVGFCYFVLDGHHRISVARARGCHALEADVTEVVGLGEEGMAMCQPQGRLAPMIATMHGATPTCGEERAPKLCPPRFRQFVMSK